MAQNLATRLGNSQYSSSASAVRCHHFTRPSYSATPLNPSGEP